MRQVIRDENKTIATAAGWALVSITGRGGVFAHAATGRVVEISVAAYDSKGFYKPLPEGADVVARAWSSLVIQLKKAGLNSARTSA